MNKIMLGALVTAGLIVAMCGVASASPATPMLGHTATAQALSVEPVYYYWNHHRYSHRSWNRARRRWRYY